MPDYATELSEQEKERIINDSMPFIKYTAYRLMHRLPPQLSVQDLISVGVMGLLDALQRYTEGRVKLNTFVEYRIKGAMLDELRSNDWVPRSLKDKIGQIKRAHRRLELELGRPPDEEEVAQSLKMTLDEYYRTLQSASNAVVFSFEDFRDRAGEDGDMDVTECIPDKTMKTPLEHLEENSAREALAQFIGQLPEKEKLILSLYYWEELTLKEIGKVMNLSEGRVCQIHNQALIRLKAQMKAPVLR
ncbi:MAG TPA: FliA/WhiG family RNA polymerase sigma factor [Nitrospirota bacterium]|nr:FliA/WhiG family RNA polymerase sigma factor [Nitrospirota bacterium]